MPKQTVRIISGDGLFGFYTAYEGESEKTAQAHIDTARNVLVLTGATATIEHRQDDRMVTSVQVVDGQFAPQLKPETKPVRTYALIGNGLYFPTSTRRRR